MKKIFLQGLAIKSENGNYRVLASSSSVDRQGDVIDQNGWELENFMKNPVVLWAHRYDELPVGKAISLEKSTAGLEMEFEFAPADGNPRAEQVKNLFEGGFLNAVSVGFIPKERNGNIITRSELLEVSIVPVPANQDALRLALEKGLNVKDILADIEKGEVAEVIDENEKREKKWQNFQKVSEIFSAMWEVYFTPETPVEDFNKIVGESISLLSKIVSGETLTDEESAKFVGKSIEKFAEFVSQKEGRVLSKKNKELINNSVSSMKSSIAVLEDLLKANDSSTDGDGKGADEVVESKNEEPITLSFDEAMALIRQNAKTVDKASEVTLSIINRFQEGRNKK